MRFTLLYKSIGLLFGALFLYVRITCPLCGAAAQFPKVPHENVVNCQKVPHKNVANSQKVPHESVLMFQKVPHKNV